MCVCVCVCAVGPGLRSADADRDAHALLRLGHGLLPGLVLLLPPPHVRPGPGAALRGASWQAAARPALPRLQADKDPPRLGDQEAPEDRPGSRDNQWGCGRRLRNQDVRKCVMPQDCGWIQLMMNMDVSF